jgi:hypothetical protein
LAFRRCCPPAVGLQARHHRSSEAVAGADLEQGPAVEGSADRALTDELGLGRLRARGVVTKCHMINEVIERVLWVRFFVA